MKNSILFLLIILGFESFACSCYTEHDFCYAVDKNNHVLTAVVTDRPEWFSMEVKILENIHLDIAADTILILGQDGLNCGESISNFHLGDSLVLALYEGSFVDAVKEEEYNWFLSTCGRHYLDYTDGHVFGPLNDTLSTQSLEQFKADIDQCLAPSGLIETPDRMHKSSTIKLYPNPAMDNIVINIEGINSNDFIFEILNISGERIISEVNSSGKITRIPIESLARNQIFFLRARSSKEVLTRKFITNY